MSRTGKHATRMVLLRRLVLGWIFVYFALSPLACDSGLWVVLDLAHHPDAEESSNHFETHHHEDDFSLMGIPSTKPDGLLHCNEQVQDWMQASRPLLPQLPPPKI